MEIDLGKLKETVSFKLIKAKLTVAEDILILRQDELQQIGNFTLEDVKQIFHVAAETLVKLSNFTALKFITTGCKIIDEVFGGGLHVGGGITELSGESGCGKTQLCLQLALTTQNPIHIGGLNKKVVYICTEDYFPSKRLQELINNVRSPFKSNQELSYGNHIYVEHIVDVSGLKSCFLEKLPKLLHSDCVGLLIVDSIAAIFRSDYSIQEGILRTKDLRIIGCQLHSLSRKYEFSILCVNQVSSAIHNDSNIPALGLAWANLVTTRLLMYKQPSDHNIRKIELVFSPHSGAASCYYRITKFGVEGLSLPKY